MTLPYYLYPADGLSVACLIAFNAGSRFERPAEQGVAHFLEHMTFQGSSRYHTELDINRRAQELGADINAETSKHLVMFYMLARAEATMASLELLTDIVSSARLSEHDTERERMVILHEIAEEQDDAIELAPNLADQAMFGPAGLGSPIAGTASTVADITRQQLIDFRTDYWRPDNGAVFVVGNTSHFDHFEANELLARFPITIKTNSHYRALAQTVKSGSVLSRHRDSEQLYIALNYNIKPYAHDELRWRAAVKILNNILRMRLMDSLRCKEGLCYGVYARVHESDRPYLQIVASVEPGRRVEAVGAIQAIIDGLGSNGVTNDEFIRTRSYCAGTQAVRLEDRLKAATFVANSALLHRLPLRSIAEWILAVDGAELSNVGQLINMIEDEPVVGFVGPLVDLA